MSLGDLILACARRQGEFGYDALVAASVLGRPFPPEVVAAILDAEVIDTAEELDRLRKRGILHLDGDLFDYRFELVREALCASISPTRRRLLRRRALRALSMRSEAY